ncbi:hypothetical protein R3W88_016413 [Solanum pinnatisectum]|uniref:Gag-asp_proteas domain-containing protein n=1 Tax=Solanum pinnatisectum TaxID=50273 RepID=A0AAV9KXB2_9SOLN|nr:hypothetical protein R3W88_016413 [Solanum pinnatisectum]
MDFETIEVSRSCSAIMSSNVVAKKDDPRAFTIPCTIGMLQFAKVLCDLGASINLMPSAIFMQLGLGKPKPTTMRLLMADHSIKHPIGILYHIFVKEDKSILLADFVILDCEIDVEVPIILGRPFMGNKKSLVDVEISCVGESLSVILLNYDGEEIQDYDEVMAALSGLNSYSTTH